MTSLGTEPASQEDLASWKQVRRHIKKAYLCLSDEQQRSAYLAQLLVAARTSQPIPEGSKTGSDRGPDQESTAAPVATPISDEDIPVAMSIAEVVDDSIKVTPDVTAAIAPVVETAKASVRRRKPGPLPLLLLIAILAGGGYGVYEFLIKPRLAVANTEPDLDTSSEQEGTTLADHSKRNQATSQRQPSTGTTEPAPPSPNESPDAPASHSSEDSGSIKANGDPPRDKETVVAVQPRPHIDTSWADLGEAGFPVQLGFYHHMEESALAMKRREWRSMLYHLGASKTYVRSPEMLDTWYRHKVVADSYRSFWHRVARKAAKLNAMTELQIGDETIVITEAKADRLIYRHAGKRIVAEYEQLPTLVALALAERKMTDDSHDVLRDRVTVYGVASGFNDAYRTEADSHVQAAATQQLWVDDFRNFRPLELKEFYQPAKQKKIARSQIGRRLFEKYAQQVPEMLGIESLHPSDFQTRMHQLRDIVLRSGPDDNEKAAVVLQLAINHCIARVQPDLVTEMLNLKKRRARAGGELPAYIASWQKMAQSNMSDESARRLLVHVLDFRRRADNSERQNTRSLQLARSIAKKNELHSELEWIESRYGKNNSRKAGRLGGQDVIIQSGNTEQEQIP